MDLLLPIILSYEFGFPYWMCRLQHLLNLTREHRAREKRLIIYASCVREGWN